MSPSQLPTTSQLATNSGQVTFPGQAAAPDGPCDLLPMFLMHHAFRRDLRMFTAAAAATPVEDRDTWRALEARWRGFARILHHHHSGEDRVLWPSLLTRVDEAGDAAGRATLEAMEAEHGEIDPLLAGCAGLRPARRQPSDRGGRRHPRGSHRASDRHPGAARAHLGHEETDAMALVQQHFDQLEWHALDKEFAKDYKPRDVLFALPWVLHDVPPDLWDRVRGFLGAPMVALWRVTLRGRFERRERRAFRYVLADSPADRLGALLVGALGAVVATDVAGGLLDVAAGRSDSRVGLGIGRDALRAAADDRVPGGHRVARGARWPADRTRGRRSALGRLPGVGGFRVLRRATRPGRPLGRRGALPGLALAVTGVLGLLALVARRAQDCLRSGSGSAGR